jgi:hypothetical protein
MVPTDDRKRNGTGQSSTCLVSSLLKSSSVLMMLSKKWVHSRADSRCSRAIGGMSVSRAKDSIPINRLNYVYVEGEGKEWENE